MNVTTRRSPRIVATADTCARRDRRCQALRATCGARRRASRTACASADRCSCDNGLAGVRPRPPAMILAGGVVLILPLGRASSIRPSTPVAASRLRETYLPAYLPVPGTAGGDRTGVSDPGRAGAPVGR